MSNRCWARCGRDLFGFFNTQEEAIQFVLENCKREDKFVYLFPEDTAVIRRIIFSPPVTSDFPDPIFSHFQQNEGEE